MKTILIISILINFVFLIVSIIDFRWLKILCIHIHWPTLRMDIRTDTNYKKGIRTETCLKCGVVWEYLVPSTSTNEEDVSEMEFE